MNPLKFRIIFALFLIPFAFGYSQGQQADTGVSELSYKDGVYNSIEEFRKNKPFKPGEYVLMTRDEIKNYFENHEQVGTYYSAGQYIWLGQFDAYGIFNRVNPDSVWGYVSHNEVFVKHNEYLVSLDVVGSICYFNTENAKLYETNKPKEFIFEYTDGKVKKFTKSNFLGIIYKDIELYQLFLKQDTYKKMNESMMEFLLRYNERNPVDSGIKTKVKSKK